MVIPNETHQLLNNIMCLEGRSIPVAPDIYAAMAKLKSLPLTSSELVEISPLPPGLHQARVSRLGDAMLKFLRAGEPIYHFYADIHSLFEFQFDQIDDLKERQEIMETAENDLYESGLFQFPFRAIRNGDQIRFYWYPGEMFLHYDHSEEENGKVKKRLESFFMERFGMSANVGFCSSPAHQELPIFYNEIYRKNQMLEILGLTETKTFSESIDEML